MRKEKCYAVYKGDTFLCLGTAEECAKKLGVKRETIKFWTTKSYKKREQSLKNAKIAIVVEED